AQLRYVGAGGSPKADDPSTLRADHFTFSLVNQPVGKFAASHSHEIVEHFMILQGVLTVGRGTPLAPVHVCHPKSKDLELSRRFGASSADKIHPFRADSDDFRHKEMASHVVRYRDRTPVWNDAGFAVMNYVGGNGAPPQHYRMDLVHLPRGKAI